jgi:Primase C terminal 2 (PriCT-2)
MTSTLQPDRAAIETFIDVLFRYADPENYISLRAFHDLEDGAPLFVEAVKVGDPELLNRVCNRISEAANHDEPYVFCPPVCTFNNAEGGKFKDLAEGVCLMVECDENPEAAHEKLTEILGPPTCVVFSGGVWLNPVTGKPEAKRHLYWRLSEPAAEAEAFEQLKEARRLAADHAGADKSAVSMVHPLRWPGSWHRKDPTKPRLARIETNPDAEIELSFALERLRELYPSPRTNGAGEAHQCNEQLHAPVAEIEAALNALPNDNLDWESWNRIGMAAWTASSGAAFEAFDNWSKKSQKYNAAATVARWEHYAASPPDRIGAGTIF